MTKYTIVYVAPNKILIHTFLIEIFHILHTKTMIPYSLRSLNDDDLYVNKYMVIDNMVMIDIYYT